MCNTIIRAVIGMLMAVPAMQVPGQAGTITHDGLQRTYTLRLPSSYNGVDQLPLIIAMHGGFGSGNQLENQSQLTPMAENEGYIMVYPDGTQGGLLNIRTWNAGWCCGASVTNNVDDVGFISALLDTLIAQYAIDTTRVYATGMSNGGFMSYRLACEMPHRIAAIAPVAASMGMAQCTPTRPVPVIAIHSYQDQSVPYSGGVGSGVSGHYNSPLDSVLNAWAFHADCQVLNDTVVHDDLLTHVRWADCACDAVVELYITQDGGHSWAGGGQGTAIGDPPSTTVSANDLMFAFFAEHSLLCPLTTPVGEAFAPATMRVMPNPSPGQFRIEGCPTGTYGIMDMAGRIILRGVSRSGQDLIVDLGDIAPGMYILHVQDTRGNTRSDRLVVRP